MENIPPIDSGDSALDSLMPAMKESKIKALATLALDQSSETRKMRIRQIFIPSGNDQLNGESEDSLMDVQRYLENLQSICFPQDISLKVMQMKFPINIKAASNSPQGKRQ